jgi:hypothetical protein
MCQIADPTRCGKYAVTVQTILRFPDHHLRATAQRVVVFDEDLCSLATDLLDTLRAASFLAVVCGFILIKSVHTDLIRGGAADVDDRKPPEIQS